MLNDFITYQRVKRKCITSFLNLHLPGSKKDILILSSHRSGSTWLAELISTQAGIKYLNEPLAKRVLDREGFLPIKTRWNYVSLSPEEEKPFKDYFANDNKVRYFSQTDFLDKSYSYLSNRRVIKVVRANALIEWFLDSLDFHVIYLVRHPIAQSISSIQRGHIPVLDEYLQYDGFLESCAGSDTKAFVRKIRDSGSPLEQFVTEWCLGNVIPLRAMETREFMTISYEEMVLFPEKMIKLLSSRLGLSDQEAMLSRVTMPSRVTDSSTQSTKNGIQSADRHYLLEKWTSEISKDEKYKAFQILERFNIDAYTAGEFIPNDKIFSH